MKRLLVAFVVLAFSYVPGPGATASCPSFKAPGAAVFPVSKHPQDDHFLGLDRLGVRGSGVWYDSARGLALVQDDHGNTYGTDRLIKSPSPPQGHYKNADLSGVRLKTGIRIGTPAKTVIALLGKPAIQAACGDAMYGYIVAPAIPNWLMLRVRDGAVIEIDMSYGD